MWARKTQTVRKLSTQRLAAVFRPESDWITTVKATRPKSRQRTDGCVALIQIRVDSQHGWWSSASSDRIVIVLSDSSVKNRAEIHTCNLSVTHRQCGNFELWDFIGNFLLWASHWFSHKALSLSQCFCVNTPLIAFVHGFYSQSLFSFLFLFSHVVKNKLNSCCRFILQVSQG